MTRRLRVAAGALLLLAVLTTCGHARVKPRTWAKDVCGTLRPWAQNIQTSVSTAQKTLTVNSDPATVKPQLVKLFGDAAAETDKAIKGVDGAGVPDVDKGDQIAKEFRAALVSARDAFRHARESVASLDASDKTKFGTDIAKIGTQLGTDYSAAGKKIDVTTSQELKKAFDKTPQCKS